MIKENGSRMLIINSSCAHPPPGNCEHLRALSVLGGRALAYPRATPGLLTHTHTVSVSKYNNGGVSRKTSSPSTIGFYVKGWSKLWRFSKVCFLDFMHFSLLIKPQLGLSLSIHCSVIEKDQREYAFKTYTTISRGWGICPLISSPPRVFAIQNRKNAYALRLAPGGGGGGHGCSWN